MSLESKGADRAPQSVREPWSFPLFPLMRPFDDLFRDGWGRKMVAVEEFTEDGTLVVRAEVPGIDPEKDVEITISDGMLHISAHRTEEEEKKGRHFHRRELRYGSFARSLPVPEGVDEEKIEASYKDGMLEVRVPLPAAEAAKAARHVPVSRG
jgi:HSP20 family protein